MDEEELGDGGDSGSAPWVPSADPTPRSAGDAVVDEGEPVSGRAGSPKTPPAKTPRTARSNYTSVSDGDGYSDDGFDDEGEE